MRTPSWPVHLATYFNRTKPLFVVDPWLWEINSENNSWSSVLETTQWRSISTVLLQPVMSETWLVENTRKRSLCFKIEYPRHYLICLCRNLFWITVALQIQYKSEILISIYCCNNTLHLSYKVYRELIFWWKMWISDIDHAWYTPWNFVSLSTF